MLYNRYLHHHLFIFIIVKFSDFTLASHVMILYTLQLITFHCKGNNSAELQSQPVLSMLRLHFLALSLSVCCFTPGIWWDLCVAGGDQYYSRYNQPQVLELPSPTRKAGIFIFRRSYTSSS